MNLKVENPKLEIYSCPVCHSNDLEKIPYPQERTFEKSMCKTCGYLFHSYWLSPESFFHWTNFYHRSNPVFAAYQQEMIKYGVFKRYLSGDGVLWDMAGGTGLALSKLTAYDGQKTIRAMEWSHEHFKQAKYHYRINCYNAIDTFFQSAINDAPRWVIMHKFLSHLPMPLVFLQRLAKTLEGQPGPHPSRVIITALLIDHPTYDNLQIGFPSEYFSLFTNESLVHLLNTAGFRVIERNFCTPFGIYVCELGQQKSITNVDHQRERWHFFQKGLAAFMTRNTDEIIKWLPNCVDAHIDKAVQFKDEPELFSRHIQALLENFPNNVTAKSQAADYFFKTSNMIKAKELYEWILDYFTTFKDLSTYADVLQSLGQYQKSAEMYFQSIDYDPKQIEGILNMIQSAYSKNKIIA